jgi:hypothetical protein
VKDPNQPWKAGSGSAGKAMLTRKHCWYNRYHR